MKKKFFFSAFLHKPHIYTIKVFNHVIKINNNNPNRQPNVRLAIGNRGWMQNNDINEEKSICADRLLVFFFHNKYIRITRQQKKKKCTVFFLFMRRHDNFSSTVLVLVVDSDRFGEELLFFFCWCRALPHIYLFFGDKFYFYYCRIQMIQHAIHCM